MATIREIVSRNICKRAIIFFIIAAVITILSTIITHIIAPDIKAVLEMSEERSPDLLKDAVGIKKVWAFVVNNGIMVPLQMFVLALIPVPFLYLLNIISTSIIPGILFGVLLQLDAGQGFEIISAAMPHYFVEVFALCLFAAMLYELNLTLRIKIKNLFTKDKHEVSLFKKTLQTMLVYLVLIVPLMTLAAFVETYISNIILSFY